MSESPGIIESLRKIQLEWELSLEQISRISHVDLQTLKTYLGLSSKAAEGLPTIPEGLDPVVPLISIFRNLCRLMPEIEKQNEWLQTPNDLFEGHRPIEVMAMSPDHLMWVSYTLESQRQQRS